MWENAMRPSLVLAIITFAALAVPISVAAQDAAPANPRGFGQATAGNATSAPGATGSYVSGVATSGGPGAVAADVDLFRGITDSQPNPPGKPATTDD
jgi:hypothetical protein